jgi:hypothetical protein
MFSVATQKEIVYLWAIWGSLGSLMESVPEFGLISGLR